MRQPVVQDAPQLEIRQCTLADTQGVVALGDQNKRTLGLLPHEAIERYIDNGHVLGIFKGQQLVAYVLYSLPRSEIRITQLCVRATWTGRGLAKRLVDEIEAKYSERRGIILHCRRDWPSNAMWPKLKFTPTMAKDGRGKVASELTVWWRDFGNPDLLTLAADSSLTIKAFLDNNVVRDLANERPQSERSRHLLEPSLLAQLVWCRTPRMSIEVNQTIDDEAERRKALRFLTNQTLLVTPEPAMVQEIVTEFKSSLTDEHRRRDGSLDMDIGLVAEAIASGGELFITNDEKLQVVIGQAAERYGIRILLPYQVSIYCEQTIDGSRYAPKWLQNSSLSSRPYHLGEPLHMRRFLSTRTGERQRDMRSRLHSLVGVAASRSGEFSVIELDNESIGLQCLYLDDFGRLEVPLLRVAHSDLENVLARQLLFGLQTEALALGAQSIVLTDQHLGPSNHLEQWLKKDGWKAEGPHWHKGVKRQISTAAPHATPKSVTQFEHDNWPEKRMGADVTTVVIPIKHAFASELLDYDNHLPFTDPRLAASRDKVYFRTKPMAMVSGRPARIVWYASGHHGGRVVGASQLLRQRSGTPEEIYEQFGDYGVLSLAQLNQRARNGRIAALVFRDTEIFDNLIDYKTMREWIAAETGLNPPTFQAPFRVSESLFERIYKQGFSLR